MKRALNLFALIYGYEIATLAFTKGSGYTHGAAESSKERQFGGAHENDSYSNPGLETTLDMTSQLSSEEYLAQRVEDQIKWYSNKSSRNKRAYQWLRVGEIIAASLIPLLTGYINGQETTLKLTVGALGLAVAVISGLLALYRLQENWLQYRTTCEALIREKYCFLTQTPPYDTTQRFPIFVQRIEALLAEENTKWMQAVEKQDKQLAEAPAANH